MTENEDIHKIMAEALKPFMDSLTGSLLGELEASNILTSSLKNGSVVYEFKNDRLQSATTTVPTATNAEDISFDHLFDLRNTIRSVHESLELPDSGESHKKPISKLFETLQENRAFASKFSNKAEVLRLLDALESITTDTQLREKTVADLKRYDFKPAIVANEMLVHLGHEKLKKHFADWDYMIPKADYGADVIMRHKDIGRIVANIKVRRGDPLPDSQSILSALKLFEDPKKPAFVLLIVFTNENAGSFARLQFQFRQLLLNEFSQYPDYVERIKFMPVWTSNLPNLAHELESFRKAYIEDKFSFEFKSQPTPRGFPDRNDHILDRTFELAKTEFLITIRPVETKFWRFGLRMIKGDTFPPLSQGRHNDEDKDIADVHICVGNAESINGQMAWENPNFLMLTKYNLDIRSEDFRGITDYNGEPVKLIIRPVDKEVTAFEIHAGTRPLGTREYVTGAFRYCRLAAWCDQAEFKLNTEIEVKFRERILK